MASSISHVVGPERYTLQFKRAFSFLLATSSVSHRSGPSSLPSSAVVHLRGLRWTSFEGQGRAAVAASSCGLFREGRRAGANRIATVWKPLLLLEHAAVTPGGKLRTEGVLSLSNDRNDVGGNR